MAYGFHYIPSHHDGTMERPGHTRVLPTCKVEGCEWSPMVDGMCIEHARIVLKDRFIIRVR
jgi:hypothetical protein